MICERCGGFSSPRICWSCSQRVDAVDYALLESYRRDAERYRWLRSKHEVRDGQPFIGRQQAGAFSRWTLEHADVAIDDAMNPPALD